MGKGFPGMPGNLQKMMQQAQSMQQNVQKAQAEAELLVAESSSGGGVVRAKVNMKGLLELEIKPEVVNPDDVEMLSDLVVAAVNEAFTDVQTQASELMKKATGGMPIPGL